MPITVPSFIIVAPIVFTNIHGQSSVTTKRRKRKIIIIIIIRKIIKNFLVNNSLITNRRELILVPEDRIFDAVSENI